MPHHASLLPLCLKETGVFLANMQSLRGFAWIWQGDISTSTFQGNSAPKGKAIFRTQSEGDVINNKKLDEDTQVTIDNPTQGT